jgi:uncharacterized secreted protein with C-terminal beta-propeller domain
MDENELKRDLERLAARGEPRGAGSVFHAARTRASISVVRRFAPAVAIAAAVTLVGGAAAAIVANRDDGPKQLASHPVDTTPTSVPGTTEPPAPEVSIPARLIAASRLVPFANCGTFTTYMRTKGLEVVSPYGLPGTGGAMYGERAMLAAPAAGQAAGAAEDSSSKASAPAAAQTAGTDYSETNVQEAGIDEPDLVKTDGKRIYAIANGRLFVVDAASPRILGSMEVGNAQEMFLVGGRAVVFSGAGGVYAGRGGPAVDMAMPYQATSRVLVVDVSDPAAMKEVSHLDVEGAYVSARLVSGVARIVFTSAPTRMQFSYPTDGTPEAQQASLAKNRDLVANAKFDDWVAHYTVTDSAGRPSAPKPLVACDSAYHPPAFSGFGQLSVMSLDPKNPGAAKTSSVAADGQTVYASATRLYVGTAQWGEVKPMPADSGGAPQIAPPSQPKTLVHVFDIADPTQARYVESGSVRGTVLNQFSFSEFDGRLRVATTDGDQSYVTVLADQGGKLLAQVGQVGGLGKGERIYAVRFIGPLGYVVTFRQVDPLYVLDLRDPAKPRVTGELKILGYSAYLHPAGDGRLIGIGQDASEEGRRLGTQVSLFDVSNPAAPKLLQKRAFGQGGSQAEYDHHAFLWWAPRNLAVIPLQEYSVDKQNGAYSQGFMGAVGMTVTPGGINEVGRVTHANDMITRSLVIGNRLFTFSYTGLKASDLGSFQEQAFVSFGSPSSGSGSSGSSSGSTEPQSSPPAEPAR